MMPYKTSVETPVGLDVQTLAEGLDRKIEVIIKGETSFNSIKRKLLIVKFRLLQVVFFSHFTNDFRQ